ncbi:MAG: flagellar filament capping protein FliD [Pseudomonadota bacterium]|nr:flagellar filament capping protein FliD [Pseudomonadota bacterium]MDO7711191.1 flagellar filament capping protein FliD [Pseudomonadota bacterium]
MAITTSGVGSGIDIESLVTKLIAAEGQPATNRLNKKEATWQADLSAYGSLKSALSSFQSAVKALNDPADFLGRTSTSSNTEVFSATADQTAVPGKYDIEVIQLAESAKSRSGNFTSADEVVGAGSLAISLGADTFNITVDSENNTLAGLRDAINAASDNPGITASIINVDGGSRLVLTSDKLGSANTIGIVASDDDGMPEDTAGLSRLATINLTTVQAAQDAIINVDSQAVTRDSNTFSDVISGVKFTLDSASPGTVESLSIGLDKGALIKNVNSFVKAYNSLADTMANLSSFNADTGAAGTLLGDSALRSVQSKISETLSSSISGLGFGSLVSIGITTNDEGNLEVDSAKLDSVMTADYTAVSQLFSSENGLAKSLDSLLERYISSDGILTARQDGLQTNIDALDGDREQLNRRLASLDERYRAQFTAMDILVAQLTSLGDYLSQQLASLPEPNSIRRR